MIAFSQNPVVAEQQMTAIITYLITFGYIDGQFDVREKVFIHEYIQALVRMRVDAMGIADPADRALITERQTAYFEKVFDRVHREIKENFDEVVAVGRERRGVRARQAAAALLRAVQGVRRRAASARCCR